MNQLRELIKIAAKNIIAYHRGAEIQPLIKQIVLYYKAIPSQEPERSEHLEIIRQMKKNLIDICTEVWKFENFTSEEIADRVEELIRMERSKRF